MCALDKTEVEKLSIMYEGDKVRDASEKIRGFLFQDYIMIKCLLQDGVEYVCSEYLEDVDVFYEDGRFEFIQVKYYPKTDLQMKPISTDLYYQYLRLRLLQSTLNPVPKLYIHGKKQIQKPTLENMKGYVDLGKVSPCVGIDPQTATLHEWQQWMNKEVYSTKKKEEQKNKLFEMMASEDSLKTFVDIFTISHQSNITQYKQELMKELSKAYPNSDQAGDEENWQLILLGLAISYIQRRYVLVNPNFDDLRVDKKEFDLYIKKSTQTKTDRTIACYLMGTVSEVYGEIIAQNTLTELQADMLNRIYQKTIQWIGEIGANKDSQYHLLNTLSKDEGIKIANYKNKDIDDRLKSLAECKDGFNDFFSYLWKIMLNICQEKVKAKTEIEEHSELFDPRHYIDQSVKDYICLNFPEDNVKYSVILPSVNGRSRTVAQRIVKAAEMLAAVEIALLDGFQEHAIRTEYQQILTVLGYPFESETLQQTYEKLKNLITDNYDVSDFSYDLFVSKLNAIESILANQHFLDLKQELDKIYQRNEELDAKIKELERLKSNASRRAEDIRKIVNQLSEDEYKKVGPTLGKFYNKLARFNATEGIQIKLESEGISLVDNNDKNIVNILSNGQISVFMLAYFFAGINVRNEREKMKVYFIDDLTACMDDVNMLAFMDLLKYQMSSKATMEQLFFDGLWVLARLKEQYRYCFCFAHLVRASFARVLDK